MTFEAAYAQSTLLATQGRLQEALVLAEHLTAAAPEAWQSHAQYGALLAALGRPHDAVAPLRHALALQPDRAELFNNVGAALRSLGRVEEAAAAFERALELAPTYRDARRNLANVLASQAMDRWRSGAGAQALALLDRAVATDPENGGARAQLGNLLAEEGRIAEAVQALLGAIALEPDQPEFYRFLAQIEIGALTEEHLLRLTALSERTPPGEGDRTDVDFALARVHAARGETERAFQHLTAANASVRERLAYDETGTLDALARIAEVFNAAFLRDRAGGNLSDAPIFIVGMPRSGTTLVEQILASHPQVHGGGEIGLFEEVARALIGSGRAIAAEDVQRASPALLRELGECYVRALRGLSPEPAARITDKMPSNFRYAGLIHLALPSARIVHVRRDPLDTCFSCFMHYFADDNMAWAYDLRRIGRYYRAYSRLMEHWRAVLPAGSIIDVEYEALVADAETQARRLVEACGLAWDERCLRFHQTRRPVRTASVAQVRRPIYRSAIRSSRAYGDLLQPLIEELGEGALLT